MGFDLSIFEVKDGKVNLTKICKHFGKRLDVWLKSNQTQKFLEHYTRLTPNGGIQVVQGKNTEQGTFGDRRIALKLAEWISVEFEVWANEQLDTLLQEGKVELQKQVPSYQIDNPIERAKIWIQEQESHLLEVKQKDESIVALAHDVQATRETLAKNYKTVNARNKADLGNAINLLVNKHFNRNGDNYARAHKDSWEAFYQATGVRYYGASNSTYEQKLTFLNFLTTL